MTHDDFPRGTEEMWDITAKALLLREGGHVAISSSELEAAALSSCEIEMLEDGSILFCVEGCDANKN